MSPEAAQTNERILAQVEDYGGGYVWESEIFAVTLIDVALQDDEAASLCGLTGVEQIALNASRLAFATIQSIASIPGLQSLVLSGVTLTVEQQALLESLGPKVKVVSDDA
jgi:hypothetical protein